MLLTYPLKGRQAQGTGTLLLWSWPRRTLRSEMGHSEASNPISVGMPIHQLTSLEPTWRTPNSKALTSSSPTCQTLT
jgi:hypothetical protein